MKLPLSVFVLLISLCGVYSLPNGAPAAACADLTPSASAHGSPQASAVPYYVYVDPLCYNGSLTYTPGQTYTLGVRGFAAAQFRGFLVQARLQTDDTTRVGTFGIEPASQADTRLSSCSPQTDGITHSNNNDRAGVYFQWTAPPAGTGSVTFGFAVVQTRMMHWANQRSPLIAEAGTNATGADCVVTTEAPDVTTAGAPQLASVGFWTLLVVALSVVIKTAL